MKNLLVISTLSIALMSGAALAQTAPVVSGGVGSSGSVLLRHINFRPWPAPHSCVGHYKRCLDNYGALLNELGPSEESAALHNRAASIRQRREHP